MFKTRLPAVCRPLIRYQSTIIAPTKVNGPDPEIIRSPTPNGTISNDASLQQIPISVKALNFPPLKIPVVHGDLKLDIQLRSYEINNLEFFADFIQRIAFYLGVPMTGPKPLPRRHEKWTVIKSPFVHAKSKENFERFTYKRLLRVWDTNDDNIEMLINLISKYSINGVGIKCNFFKNESIDISKKQLDNKIVFDSIQNNNDNDDLVNSRILELLNSNELEK